MKTNRARFENKTHGLKQQFCMWTPLINRYFESNDVYL